MIDIHVLLCYRGRFKNQVATLDRLLTERGLAVTFDAEILQPGVEYGSAEIEWMSLGFDDDGDTSWRGPLSEAVGRSELIVFLMDAQDPSVNVLNEIAWASRSNKPLFVVFNSKGESHSADWEAIQVSQVQIAYSLATGDPEVPAFGHHFVTHEADEGLDRRLTILVNRIVSYLDQVRRGEVGTIRVDTGVTLSDVENAPSARARRRLKAVQEQIAQAVGIESSPVEGDPLQNALAVAHRRERDGETRNGRIYPKNSPFSYPEESERERYRRTEALLEIIRPGPFENPFLIEMLARELVSIQMVLDEPIPRSLLIGTVFVTPSDVPGDVLIEPDNAVLLVDASLVDYTYQMLKAAVMSWKIVSPSGVMPVSMSSRIDDTREVIARSPELVSRFAQALGQMIREGRPGSTTVGQPPPAYHPALSMLIAFQKRFTVAVALARMVALDMILARAAREEASPPAMPSEEWILAADRIAARWVFDSGTALDRVDPTIALHGLSLGLASYDLIERSLVGFHPPEIVPARARAQHVAEFFSEHLVARRMPREEAEQRRDGLRGILATLDLLWRAATGSGELPLGDIEISARWQRHMTVRSGSGDGRGAT